MNRKEIMILICAGSLSLGAVIYLFSRPDAYVSILFSKIFHINRIQVLFPSIVSYYIPDFLWAVSLCSGLIALVPIKWNALWGILTALYGVLWEGLQFICAVNGTADIIDIIMYLSAAISVVMINYFIKMREEK